MPLPALLALLTLLASASACGRSLTVEATPPAVVDDLAESPLPVPVSIVEAKIRYDLNPAITSLEQAVPLSFGDMDKRLRAGSSTRAHYAFTARRSPFVITVAGQRINLGSTLDYEARGWYKPPFGPEVSAACGTGGAPRPRARVRLESTMKLSAAWRINARSKVLYVKPASESSRDRCRITALRIDVTGMVMRATREKLEEQLSTLDSALAGIDTRTRFESWWRAMSRPIRLADSVYFTINPSDVQFERIDVDSGFATARIRLTTRPRITTGPRPDTMSPPTPLPDLHPAPPAAAGFLVALEGEFGYDVASRFLRKELVGHMLRSGGQQVFIRDVTLAGIGGGRVALGVRFDGSARGIVYFTGTPSYDNSTDLLRVLDLSYDLHTTSLLVNGLEWLRGDWLRDYLRERARFPIRGRLDRLRELAVRGMNRRLAEGVTLVADLDPARNVSVRATRRALIARADASGHARLEIDRPLVVRWPGATRERASRPAGE